MEVISYKAGWKINQDEEACYIEIEADECSDVKDESCSDSQWCNLPDLLLENIFSYLEIRERYYCTLVCKNWYRAFYLKNVWRNFHIEDDTLCRHKFNYYSGWQPVLDCLRSQTCLTRIGRFMKGIEIMPAYNFNNISQFMTLLTFNIQQSRRGNYCEGQYFEVGKRIESFKYIFPCNMNENERDVKLYGTGGQLLKTLKSLLFELNRLKNLKLIDLMLERYEAKHLLDEVLESCNFVMQHLCLINVTSTHCPILHVGLFFNLQVLIISPQNLDDDVLQLLANTSLKHLHIFQNKYSPVSPAACSEKAWKLFRKDNSKIQVHLRFESTTTARKNLTLQPSAPVYSITYRSPETQITANVLIPIVDMYKYTLAKYGHELIPEFTSPKSFDDRIDSLLLLMARQCPNLTSLTIRETISTSTLLLLAKTAINLCELNVRRCAVIPKMEWPENQSNQEFFEWLHMSSRSYEETEREISKLLGCRWTMMSDEAFQKLKIHLPGFSG